MAVDVGELQARLTLDTAKYTRAMEEATRLTQRSLAQMQAQGKAAAAGLEHAFDAFVERLQSVNSTAGRTAAAIESFKADLLAVVPVLGTAAAVGAGVVTMLIGLSTKADEVVTSFAALGKSMRHDFLETSLEIQRIRDQAAGRTLAVIEDDYQKELLVAEATADRKIAAAEKELEATSGIMARMFGLRALAEEKFNATLSGIRQAREGDEAVALERRTAAENKYYEHIRQLGEHAADQAEALASREADAAARAAEQAKAQLERFVVEAGKIVEGLGPEFADVGRALDLSQYLTKTQQSMQALTNVESALVAGGNTVSDAFTAAGISATQVRAAINKLEGQMAEAIKNGTAPMAESMVNLTNASKELGEFAVKNSAALANFSDSTTKTDQAIRALLDGALAKATPGFNAMGREIDQLTADFNAAAQTSLEFTAGMFTVGESAKEAAEKIETVEEASKRASEAMAEAATRAAEAARAMDEIHRAQQQAIATFTQAVMASQASIQDLIRQLSHLGGSSFSFVQDPRLREQIEALRREIVMATGAQRIELVQRLNALLEANRAQLDADRVAADIQAEWRALDERRNQLLEQLLAEEQRMNQSIIAFGQQVADIAQRSANQAGQNIQDKTRTGGGRPMQHGGVVGGTGSGDIVPAWLEPGEVVVPRNRAAAALQMWPDLAGGSTRAGHFQRGGSVPRGAGVSVVVQGAVTEVNARRLAREIVAAERLERTRGTL